MENLETLVTIITEKNKIIENLKIELKSKDDLSMFWYLKFKDLEKTLIPEIIEDDNTK
jgi:hypothetical protein